MDLKKQSQFLFDRITRHSVGRCRSRTGLSGYIFIFVHPVILSKYIKKKPIRRRRRLCRDKKICVYQ